MLSIGIVGLGNIGSAVSNILTSPNQKLKNEELKVIGAVVQNMNKKRSVNYPIFNNIAEIMHADIIVELTADAKLSSELARQTIAMNKYFVTANKAMLASHLDEFIWHPKLYFEASVGGAVPMISIIRDALCANDILEFKAILNGTCNFILSYMEEGHSFNEALNKAQKLGYAEPDPSFDISGLDSANKLSILASLAFKKSIPPSSIYVKGITNIKEQDFNEARANGATIRLLSSASNIDGKISLSVEPTRIPLSSPLSSIKGADNAIMVNGDKAGELFLRGRGAGAVATASAVIGDVVLIARKIRSI